MIILLSSLCARSAAQNDTTLMKQLEEDSNKTTYTTATFKSTRLITGHTVETLGKGILDVRILHRFAPINGGIYEFFGLDEASMRMGFDYGITNDIMVGVGHSTFQKTYDALFKMKILKQSTGAVNMPVTLSFVSTIAVHTEKTTDAYDHRINPSFIDMSSFSEQLIVGRKFSNNFSLQFMPIYIFHDKVDSINANSRSKDTLFYGSKRKNTMAFGFGGRWKVSKRVAINLEYYYQLPDTKSSVSVNSFSVGIDLETGGHIFQMHFTNSTGMTEKVFITDTKEKWKDGYVRFGFNISRVFRVAKH